MSSREERRLADQLAGWLEEGRPAPTEDPTSRAIARTAVLLLDALAPQPLHPLTRARLYERALGQAQPGRYLHEEPSSDPLGDLLRLGREMPAPAWLGLAGIGAALVVGLILLRQREGEPAA